MKTKVIFLSVIFIALLLFLSVFINSFFNGDTAKKEESKELVVSYLEENYSEQSFTITDVAYYPGEGTYIVHVVSKDGKVEGNIDVRNGKIFTEGAEFPFKETNN